MVWSYRLVKKKLNVEEDSFDVCEVYYDEKGAPVSYAPDKNVLSQDSYEDSVWAYEAISRAYKEPVLENTGKELIELTTCPKCEKPIVYDIMDVMGDGHSEENFGQTVLTCSDSKECGYVAVRRDYTTK